MKDIKITRMLSKHMEAKNERENASRRIEYNKTKKKRCRKPEEEIAMYV